MLCHKASSHSEAAQRVWALIMCSRHAIAGGLSPVTASISWARSHSHNAYSQARSSVKPIPNSFWPSCLQSCLAPDAETKGW